jgi:molecular chaperone DnaK (HSP70)
MEELIVGIDLGTTNSEVAIIENGQPLAIPYNGALILPSVVGLSPEGRLLVGEAAKNQSCLYPEQTIKSIKRKMGTAEKIRLGEQLYRPQEISAMILRELKFRAEEYLQREVRKAVISVPAYFSDAQRQATREAGEIAGLSVVRIINEPTAASLTYEAGKFGGKKILVYDLGGGTFDVSVVHIQDNVVEVLSSHGNNRLGGDDFDQAIVNHIIKQFQQQYDLDPAESPRSRARILRCAENAKIYLSTHPYIRIEEEYIAEKKGIPLHLNQELTLHEYENMIRPYIEDTFKAVYTALRDAGLKSSDLHSILLVGGASKTPLITRLFEERLHKTPAQSVNPDLCVALGASIQAGIIAGEKVSSVLVDVTPYTFGTSAFDEMDGVPYPYVYIPIIRKNTSLPVSRSDLFYTMYDDQDQVEVNIYQGESVDAKKNILIGRFMVEDLSKIAAGNEITITFDLDLNGILHVSATEKRTGKNKKITIDNAISRFEDEEIETAKGKIVSLFDYKERQRRLEPPPNPAKTAESRLILEARSLLEKAEQMLPTIPAEDKETVVDLIETINDQLQEKTWDDLPESLRELSEILFYLEEI